MGALLNLKFSLLFFLLGVSLPLSAQDFLRRTPRIKIGSVISLKGNVLALGSTDRSIHYLKRESPIYDKQTIVTRANSQLVLKLGLRSRIIMAGETKITISSLIGSSRYLIRLNKGVIRHDYSGAGKPEVYVSGKSFGTYYSALEFDAILKGNRFYFKPQREMAVYKYQRKGVKDSRNLEVSRKDIELLSEREGDSKPVYLIKTAKLKKKGKTQTTPSDTSNLFESSLDEASSIFGDSISETSAVDDAADIFGVEVQTKSKKERQKLRDNIGVKLEDKLKTMPKIAQEEKKKKSAFDDLDISLFLKSTFYTQEPRSDVGKVDNQSFHQDIRVTVANKIAINDNESLTMSAWLEGSNRKEIYNEVGDTLDLQSSKRNYLYLNELYYTFSTRKYDIQFGKKVIKTGKGVIFSPTDSFTSVDATMPTSPVFLGNFFFSVDYYLKGWTLTGMLFPTIVPNKSPTQNSRWTTLYSDIDFKLEQEFPSGFSPKTRQVFFKLEGTKWGTDWLFTVFNGPNTNPVVRNDIVVNNNIPTFNLVQEHIPITFVSAGFSTTLAGFELHGEILNQNAEDGKDDSFTAMMVGFRYTMDEWPKKWGLNSIDTIIEHGRESLRSAQSQPFYALSSIGSRFYQNSWVGTFIFNVTDKFSFNYDFHFDLKNDGTATILGMNYTSGNSQWRIKAESYEGSDNSNFGQWRDNDNTSLEYVYNW